MNMQEINFQCLRDIVLKASDIRPLDTLTEMYIRLYVLGTAQFTCEWILGKWEITAEKLSGLLFVFWQHAAALPIAG